MKSWKKFFCAASFLFTSGVAHADMYKCWKMVYKEGLFKKYEYLGNTWGANTKKHGAFSSTAGSTTEHTTASVDPIITSKELLSTAQYSSSWGECAAIDYEVTQEFRTKYIEQNIVEIKKQISVGDGYHLASLAFLSGCQQIDHDSWVESLRSNIEQFYDTTSGQQFDQELQHVIKSDKAFSTQCKLLAKSY